MAHAQRGSLHGAPGVPVSHRLVQGPAVQRALRLQDQQVGADARSSRVRRHRPAGVAQTPPQTHALPEGARRARVAAAAAALPATRGRGAAVPAAAPCRGSRHVAGLHLAMERRTHLGGQLSEVEELQKHVLRACGSDGEGFQCDG